MKFLRHNYFHQTKFCFRVPEGCVTLKGTELPDERFEAALSLGGVANTERYGSLAGETLRMVQEASALPTFATSREPENKVEFLKHYPGIILPKINLSVDADPSGEAQAQFREDVRGLGSLLQANGVERLDVILDTIAGVGSTENPTLTNLIRGKIQSHDSFGNETPEFIRIKKAAEFVTGDIYKIVFEELTETGLVDAETHGILIGYNSHGYNDDGTLRDDPHPVMSRLYEPINAGKVRAEKVAAGNRKVYNAPELFSPSSRAFLGFSAIVIGQMYQKLWSDEDARKNPFWQQFFSEAQTEFPDAESWGIACEKWLNSLDLADFWASNIGYGEKVQGVSNQVSQIFGDVATKKAAERFATMFTQYAARAYGARVMQAIANDEYPGQQVIYFGHQQLAEAEVSPRRS